MTLHGPDPDLFRTKVYGARWYVDGLPADDIAPATDDRWPSVTTIKKAWSKPFRKKLETGELVSLDAYWAAEFIVDHLDTVESLGDDRAAALTLVATSPARRLNAAAGRGTGVHTVMEDLMAGKGVGFVDPAVEPFVAGCKAFVEDWAPVPVASEFVVVNRTVGFGGTGDAILSLTLDGKAWVALVDYKSRSGDHGAYEEDVAQIGGYSLAEYMVVLGPDGRPMRMALPALDAGLVVSLNADGYAAFPVDLGDAQAAFLAMHSSWQEHREGQKAARRARSNPLVLPSTTGNPTERQTLSEPPAGAPEWLKGQDVVEDQGPELLAERKAWLQDRVDAIKAAGHAETLARRWSEDDGVPTFPKGGPRTAAEMDVVSQICWDTEGAHGMPFPDTDDPAIVAFEAEAKAKGLV